MARPLRDRLKFDLERNREELIQVVTPIDDLGYAPAEGMKSYRDQLAEIGGIEIESVDLITTGKVPEWAETQARITGTTLNEVLHSLAVIRQELVECLDSLTDQELVQAIDVPHEWASFVGDITLEREELFRWLARHEYYHLGQIITYRWIQGINPYN